MQVSLVFSPPKNLFCRYHRVWKPVDLLYYQAVEIVVKFEVENMGSNIIFPKITLLAQINMVKGYNKWDIPNLRFEIYVNALIWLILIFNMDKIFLPFLKARLNSMYLYT